MYFEHSLLCTSCSWLCLACHLPLALVWSSCCLLIRLMDPDPFRFRGESPGGSRSENKHGAVNAPGTRAFITYYIGRDNYAARYYPWAAGYNFLQRVVCTEN